MPASALLDNITWHALAGPQSTHAVGTSDARRYAPGFSPILGFADPSHANFAGLVPFCDTGEHFYTDGWTGSAPPGWRVDVETTMFKMIFDAPPPSVDEAPEALPLNSTHAARALELATLTRPGPFGIRTIELGEYYGCFDGNRLVAMAGERMFAGNLREVSGVCTHPDYERRGFAHRLMAKLIRRQMQRGETPFLHVMRSNENARALYTRMGFRDYRESVVRVVAREAQG